MTPIQIVFEVHGEPKPQPRPRAFAQKTAFGLRARVFDAGTAEGWKSLVAEAVRPSIPAEPIEGPLALVVDFWLPRPAGHFVASKRERGLKPNAPVFHINRPDADNLAKAVLDALTVVRLWHEDDQVAELVVSKLYEDPATGPGALVRIHRPAGYVVAAAAPEQPALFSEAAR